MNGILVIDKSPGPTSHDVVAKIRKLLRQKKVGHTGTLDPIATGVLPLVIGSATKIARYLTGGDKTYRAVIRLGITTETLDVAGKVIEEKPVEVDEAEVRKAFAAFVGEINQVPPMYSAKKVGGKRLYELARKGVEVEREPKRVTIHEIEVQSCDLPEVTVEVRCTAGTYLRVLAEDVGEALGCGGHLKELRRLVAGPFSLGDAITLESIEGNPELAAEHLLPTSRGLASVPRIEVPVDIGRMVASGYQLSVADLRTLDTPEFAEDELIALWLDNGELLAVARALLSADELSRSRRDRHALKTERVLRDLRG